MDRELYNRLFVILTLSGVIYFHLSSSGMNVSVITPHAVPQTTSIRQTEKKRLINDVIEEVVFDNVHVNRYNQIETNKTVGRKIEAIDIGRSCSKKINVSFLKVHKAGSTTIMNIFLRFAISNQLNIVLPPKSNGFGFNYLGYGTTVSKDKIVPLPNNETYNILCNHVVYNKEAFHSIMPENTVYVGILREPISHFRSAASYYGFYNHIKNEVRNKGIALESTIIDKFLKNPSSFSVGTYFVYNRMSFDFGIPKSQFHNDVFVDEYIRTLDKDYGLVMLMEKFHESLVLLKRRLCWHTKDILYVPLNARRKSSEFSLTEEDVVRLKRWNSADFKLYDHFSRVFDQKVDIEGNDFLEEVESFRYIQETVKTFCVSRQYTMHNLSIPETKWDSSFEVTASDCRLMREDELHMMKRLIEDAWKHFDVTEISKTEEFDIENGCEKGICF